MNSSQLSTYTGIPLNKHYVSGLGCMGDLVLNRRAMDRNLKHR